MFYPLPVTQKYTVVLHKLILFNIVFIFHHYAKCYFKVLVFSKNPIS